MAAFGIRKECYHGEKGIDYWRCGRRCVCCGAVKKIGRAGADYFINSRDENPAEAVREILPDGADFVLDAVGVNDLINTAMHMIKDNGQICVYGISPIMDMQLSWARAPYNWSVKFVQFPVKKEEADAHDQIIEWVRSGVLDLKDYVSHVLPFDRILDAFSMIEKKVPVKKIVITYE